MQKMDNWLEQYGQVLENLNADNLTELEACLTEGVEFRDPFNHSHCRDDFISIMRDMFEKLDNVSFVVHQTLDREQHGYLYWTFTASSRTTGNLSVEGTSRVEIDDAGLICLHHDFWDASELLQGLPVLGRIIAMIRRKLSHRS